MMRYIQALCRRFNSLIKLYLTKMLHFKCFSFESVGIISISTRFIFLDKGIIKLGRNVSTRRDVEFRMSKEGRLSIGEKSFFNNYCLVVCHERITIGNNCAFGPNVMIFDHDHDFREKGWKSSGQFKNSPVIIGNNVWIGANMVILKGTIIGDNCVIGAGAVIKGDFPDDSVIVQKRETTVSQYEFDRGV